MSETIVIAILGSSSVAAIVTAVINAILSRSKMYQLLITADKIILKTELSILAKTTSPVDSSCQTSWKIFTRCITVIRNWMVMGYTEMDNGKVTFSFHVEDEDYDEWIDLIYDFSYEGTWRVKGNKLIQKGDKFIMEFSSFSTMQKYNPDVDDYYINALKSMMEEQIPELRHDNLKKRTQKIIDMSDDEMTVEENGEKTNMVRLK